MPIRDLIARIAEGWSTYRQKLRVDGKDPVYAMVVEQLPDEIRRHVSAFDKIIVEGSTGAGNITAAPWIALFDSRLTTSATTGYYPVYLFSTDLKTVTLTLAFGTTQFEKQFGGPAASFPRLRFAASRLQDMFNHIIPASLSRTPIDLTASPAQKLHYSYEQSAILSYPPYDIAFLPEEAELSANLQQLVALYTKIVSDPLEATVERLVEAAVEPATEVHPPDVKDFQIREPAKESGAGKPGFRRYSPESRKVGDAGERIVFNYERDRLVKLGHQDLADRVRWHSQHLEFPGWDITSFDEQGQELFIEVKGSIGKFVSVINLTVNEWNAANAPSRAARYFIYLVTNTLSEQPAIERIANPAALVQQGKINCEPIVYSIELRSAQK